VHGDDDIVSLSYLFDRPRSNHPWLDVLSELDQSSAIGEPPVTANWRMDHRVEPSREDALLAPGGFLEIASSCSESFRQVRQNYFEQFLCRPVGTDSGSEPPAYLTDANLGNRIPADRVSPNHSLLHRALSGGYPAGDLEIKIENKIDQSLSTTIDAATVDRLAASVRSAGEGSVRCLAGLISDTLGPTEPHC